MTPSTQYILTVTCNIQKCSKSPSKLSDTYYFCGILDVVVYSRDVRQRQWVSMAMAILTERERPLHPFPLQLLLGAVAAAVN